MNTSNSTRNVPKQQWKDRNDQITNLNWKFPNRAVGAWKNTWMYLYYTQRMLYFEYAVIIIPMHIISMQCMEMSINWHSMLLLIPKYSLSNIDNSKIIIRPIIKCTHTPTPHSRTPTHTHTNYTYAFLLWALIPSAIHVSPRVYIWPEVIRRYITRGNLPQMRNYSFRALSRIHICALLYETIPINGIVVALFRSFSSMPFATNRKI